MSSPNDQYPHMVQYHKALKELGYDGIAAFFQWLENNKYCIVENRDSRFAYSYELFDLFDRYAGDKGFYYQREIAQQETTAFIRDSLAALNNHKREE